MPSGSKRVRSAWGSSTPMHSTTASAFRGGINGSEIGFDDEESGIAYDFDFVWDSLLLAVDFHPLSTCFSPHGRAAEERQSPRGREPPDRERHHRRHRLYAAAGWNAGRTCGFRRRDAARLGLGLVASQALSACRSTSACSIKEIRRSLCGAPALCSATRRSRHDIAAETAQLDDSLADLDVVAVRHTRLRIPLLARRLRNGAGCR